MFTENLKLFKGPCTISIDKRLKIFKRLKIERSRAKNNLLMAFFKEISKICEKNNLCWGTKVKIVKQNKKLGNIKESFEILTGAYQPKLFFLHIFEISLKNAISGLFFAMDLLIFNHLKNFKQLIYRNRT